MMIRCFKLTLAIFLALAWTASALAERKVTVSGSLDFLSAADSNPSIANSGFLNLPDQGTTFSYSLFPSLSLRSTGPESQFQLSYSLGFNRFESRSGLNHESHSFGAEFQSQLTKNLSMRLLDSFRKSPDFSSASFISGIGFDPAQGFFFEFDTVAVRRDSTANTAVLSFDYTLNPYSSLSFGSGYSFRTFEESPSFQDELSDQNRIQSFLRYNRRLSANTSWNLGISAYHYDFKDFENVRTYEAGIGLNHELSPRLSLSLSAGPSFVDALQGGEDSAGYNAQVTLSKTLDRDSVSISYQRRSGASTGAGSVSDTHQLNLEYRRIWGRLTLDARASAYDTSQKVDNTVSTQGYSAGLTASWAISEHWFISLGGSFLNQDGNAGFDLERNRVYIAMRYSLPDFWRF